MTDPTPATYPQAGLRIAVAYAATDGSVPESVELEWKDAPEPDKVAAIVDILARIPAGARAGYAYAGEGQP